MGAVRYDSIQEMVSVRRNRGKVYYLPTCGDTCSGPKVRLATNFTEEWRTSLPIRNERGQNVWRLTGFIPGEWYQVDDVGLLNILKGKAKVKKAYSQDLENTLKGKGVPYEVVKCKTCGGRVTKIEYSVLEIEEG